MVDAVSISQSFVATTGLLTAEEDLQIEPKTNFADNAVYTFTFSENSMVPKDGFIRIDFPDDVKFVEGVTLTTESCDPAIT